MIPQMHKPTNMTTRWAWNLMQRQEAYYYNFRWWLVNKRRFAKKIVDGQAIDHETIVMEFGILDRLTAEAVTQSMIEDKAYNE